MSGPEKPSTAVPKVDEEVAALLASAPEPLRAILTARLQALEASLNGIAVAALDGTLTYVNAAFVRMWGLGGPAEALGRPAPDFWAMPGQAAAVLGQVAAGAGWVGELEAVARNGKLFVVELSASMIRDGIGAPLALMGSFVDVTERTRAVAALRHGEERLRQATRVALMGIFDHDQRSDAIYWSPRQREIYGVGADEVITLKAFVEFVHPEDRERIAEAVLRAHAPDGDGLFDVEHRVVRRDGAVRWLTTRSRTFFEGEGEGEGAERRPVRTVGAVLDVTDAHQAQAERARLREQLEQARKMESIGRLAGGVAHDFNNMLAVILGNAELLRPRLRGDREGIDDLGELERAAQRARDITRQLLAFSRKQVIAPQPLALNDLLASLHRTLSRLIGEDVVLQFVPGRDLWRVELDPAQLDQIIVNLAGNARDAMPRGGKLTVETANVHLNEDYCRRNPGFQSGEYVLLAVSDTGVGMDRETRERIFEPFFTTKPKGQGTGLGLATVYGIVAQNGGMVHVYSEPGLGSTFKIYLPRLRGEALAEPAPEASPMPTPGGTVLLVEDEPMVRRTTAAMLVALGYDVLAVASAVEALGLAAQPGTRLDLLLTDVVMPSMSGKELRDRLLRLRPALPVVFMSGYTTNVIVHHGVLESGLHLLQKPFSMEDLARVLAEARCTT
jgi:PAS domain S-box-containing protein